MVGTAYGISYEEGISWFLLKFFQRKIMFNIYLDLFSTLDVKSREELTPYFWNKH